MSRSIQEVLAPAVTRKTISRIAMPGTVLSQLFRWNLGRGPVPGAVMNEGGEEEGNYGTQRGNVEDYDYREGSYDIYDNTRTVATGRSPGQPSHLIAPQRVGKVSFTVPRMAESLDLKYEDIHNRRRIGSSPNIIDRQGERYIEKQRAFLAARFANAIELQTAGMLRGRYYFVNNERGDAIYQSLTTPPNDVYGDVITIDYKIPDSHRGQLDMNGDGDIISATWDNTATDIHEQLLAVNKAFLQQTGQGIGHVVLKSSTWAKIVRNTSVQELALRNAPVETMTRDEVGRFTVKLRGVGWITFHIVDYGLDVWQPATRAFSYQDVIDDGVAVFLPEINSSWTGYLRGGEHVVEGPNGRESFQNGFYAYGFPVHDPAGWRMTALHNGFPQLFVPKAVAYGTVIF